MQYLLLIYGEPETGPAPDTPEYGQELEDYFAFNREAQRRGVYLGGNALEGVSTATTVRVRGDDTLITDGPFAETKEALGGYYLVDCADLDKALELAAMIPGARHGSVEVRPVWQMPGDAG